MTGLCLACELWADLEFCRWCNTSTSEIKKIRAGITKPGQNFRPWNGSLMANGAGHSKNPNF